MVQLSRHTANTTSGGSRSRGASAAQRKAWNTSTKLPIKPRTAAAAGEAIGGDSVWQAAKQRRSDTTAHVADVADDHNNGQDKLQLQRHTRCSSPSCRERRRRPPRVCGEEPEPAATTASSAVNHTRAMIERAVDAALITAQMQDVDLLLGDKSLELAAEDIKQNEIDDQPRKQNKQELQLLMKQQLASADVDAHAWRRQYYIRRRGARNRTATPTTPATTTAQTTQQMIRSARDEYEQRKHEIQSLQRRVKQEIQFLQTTMLELAQREAHLDQAFGSYEQWLENHSQADDDVDDSTGSRSSNTSARAG